MVIRLLIVDDQQIVRQGLKMFFEIDPDIEMVGEAENGKQAIELAVAMLPTTILIDLLMPVMNGVDAIRHIHRELPEIAIIAISTTQDSHLINEAIDAGAQTVIPKNVSPQKLLETIKVISSL